MLYLQERPYSLPALAGLRPKFGYRFPIAASAPARSNSGHATPPLPQVALGDWNPGVTSHRRGHQRAHRYSSGSADSAEPSHRDSLYSSKSRVDLAELHVWIANGVHVNGKGLKIFGATDPNPWEPGVQPLLEIEEFHFQTALRNLFREPMHVDTVFLAGLSMNIPPKSDRQQMNNLRRRSGKMSIMVDRFVCTNTKLIINNAHPAKAPMEFDISDLRMKDVGPGLSLRFDATLVIPSRSGTSSRRGNSDR